MPIQDNMLLREGLRELQHRLPFGWSVGELGLGPANSSIDAVARVTAPDSRSVPIALEARTRLDPKGVLSLAEAKRAVLSRGPLVVIATYLSEATRARLQAHEIGYLDLTGNIRIVIPEPGLFIEAHGATKEPNRDKRATRSLRGAKTGRIVRTLVDRKQPPGVRELAVAADTNAGNVSRVLALLDKEALVIRVGRGRLQSVDWQGLLRRWAKEAPIESRGRMRTYLEPRGLSTLMARLATSSERYVITGGLAAAAFAPAAPTRLATIWIRDSAEAARRLGLRPAETGANVLLIEPHDTGVFDGAVERDSVWYAAPSQVAVDLLTSPGRGPSEGEELLNWMSANEEVWRR